MKFKKKTKTDNTKQVIQIKREKSILEPGIVTAKDILSPSGFDFSEPSSVKIDGKYSRTFTLEGYPTQVDLGWLDYLYHYDGNMDTAVYIFPADERTVLEELTRKITQYESQLHIESSRGDIRNLSVLQSKIRALYDQRKMLEQNYENLFHVQIVSNLYANSLEQLNKETQMLDSYLVGRKIMLKPNYLRQIDGYKTCLPLGLNCLADSFRNLNTGSLGVSIPFYNGEISHENGVFMGINYGTKTAIYVNFFNRQILSNGNFTVMGKSGMGKTYFLNLFSYRQALKDVQVAIIDPEGDYGNVTKKAGGSTIEIAQGSNSTINPFDLEEEEVINKETGKLEKIVNIKEKIADILNLVGVMAGKIDQEERSLISSILQTLYTSFGFTEDPESLYEKGSFFNEETGEYLQKGVRKKMPQFSDFHDLLVEVATKENYQGLLSIANSLEMFKKGGVYDLFDCQTNLSSVNLETSPIISFNVSKLEENILRPIGMYVALSWCWEKFAKKKPNQKKMILVDEAWMFLKREMAGSEYTSMFLETCSRRIRKRNGSLGVASQRFSEFANNESGQAIISNSSVNIFLGQKNTDIDALQASFKLSDGERKFVLQAQKGEFLLKLDNGESTSGYNLSFDWEQELFGTNK